jgi:hypothetical protein
MRFNRFEIKLKINIFHKKVFNMHGFATFQFYCCNFATYNYLNLF